jgi:hypothetical protein
MTGERIRRAVATDFADRRIAVHADGWRNLVLDAVGEAAMLSDGPTSPIIG